MHLAPKCADKFGIGSLGQQAIHCTGIVHDHAKRRIKGGYCCYAQSSMFVWLFGCLIDCLFDCAVHFRMYSCTGSPFGKNIDKFGIGSFGHCAGACHAKQPGRILLLCAQVNVCSIVCLIVYLFNVYLVVGYLFDCLFDCAVHFRMHLIQHTLDCTSNHIVTLPNKVEIVNIVLFSTPMQNCFSQCYEKQWKQYKINK